MSTWTVDRIPNLEGKVALVTGANSGIGFWTAQHLAQHGARVVLACRSTPKAADAVAEIRAAVPHADLDVLALDLADLASVRAATASFVQDYDRLDIQINNAGIALLPYATTVDGFESHLAANFLGHFALTAGLIGTVLATPGSRIVHVGSLQHHLGRIDLADPNFESRRFRKWAAYGQSKLAQLQFMLELDRRLRRIGSGTISVGAHPGTSGTGIASSYRAVNAPVLGSVATFVQSRVLHSPEEAAMPSLMAATDPGMLGGTYVGPSRWFGAKGAPGPARLASRARRDADAASLWRCAEEWAGVTFAGLDP